MTLTSQDSTNNTVDVQFDISWSNSWRNQVNRDAAWVFVKYSTDSGTTWAHATLKTSGTNPSGFDDGTGTSLDIVVPSDLKGAFIERSASGTGAISNTSVQLVWDYGTDGLADTATARVQVFGIEMCYIPAGSFYAGDISGSISTFKQGSSDDDPWYITSEGAISVTNTASNGYYYPGEGDAAGTEFTIAATFPKGYAAFYLMKYELTQGQWVAFFNTLTAAQKLNRDITDANGKNTDSADNRNVVAWTTGDATTTRTDRAMNWLSWPDSCAFADWAALRPYTELEFEKACRGPNAAVTTEYVWGNTTVTQAATISGSEDGTETISTASANMIYGAVTWSGGDAGQGPLRVGIFATSTSTRTQAGAGYYGNLNMADNVYERTVTVGRSEGRSFTGSNGDGALTTTASYEGNASNTDWPGIDGTAARGVTGATGSGYRGSDFADSLAEGATSYRNYAADTNATRHRTHGFRAARTA